jgi:hypothetical protein
MTTQKKYNHGESSKNYAALREDPETRVSPSATSPARNLSLGAASPSLDIRLS